MMKSAFEKNLQFLVGRGPSFAKKRRKEEQVVDAFEYGGENDCDGVSDAFYVWRIWNESLLFVVHSCGVF